MSDVRPGRLKVYLGAAPGVGKTYRMLDEGRRRASRGADLVVGFAECHGRPSTEAMLDGLEAVPRASCAHRGGRFEAGRVELRIVDRGPGPPTDGRERLFEPFQRLGDTDNTTGLGLGLALARGLTDAMNGTLAPEDTPGGGLTMVVSLPFAEATGQPLDAEPTEETVGGA